MTTGHKFHKDKLFAKIEHTATSGVVGKAEYEVFGEVELSVASTFATSGTLTVQARIKHSDSWQTVGTLASGGEFSTFDIAKYDYVRFNFTVAAGSAGEIAASGFFNASPTGVAGAKNGIHRVILDHAGTTVTVVEDLGGVLTSATHNTTGVIDIVWNQDKTGSVYVPGITGIVCASNVVGHLVDPTVSSCQIVTKLNSSGANFTAGRTEFHVKKVG